MQLATFSRNAECSSILLEREAANSLDNSLSKMNVSVNNPSSPSTPTKTSNSTPLATPRELSTEFSPMTRSPNVSEPPSEMISINSASNASMEEQDLSIDRQRYYESQIR